MKKLLFVVVLAAGLGGCANYQANLATFTNDVVATNQAIAAVSQSLATNCNQLQSIAQSAAALTGVFTSNPKARAVVSAANAVLETYCTAPPTDIASAVATVAAQVSAAKSAYNAALKG